MIYINITKNNNNNAINIAFRDDKNILHKKSYFDYTKREALKKFKSDFDLKFKRNVIILDDN